MTSFSSRAVLVGLCLMFNASLSAEEKLASGEIAAEEVFNSRIMPIFQSSNPSSCVQCHLSSVDLKEYILPSHEKTFLSLRDQGLIDLSHPGQSKILTLIRMGDKDLDEGARLIHEETRQKELNAFSEWIKACCNDRELVSRAPLSPSEVARPEKPDAVIRHARRSSVVDSFAKHVWTMRMRCFPCHTPNEIDESNPRHQAPIKTLTTLTEKHPEFVSRMEIFKKTPEETLDYLIQMSQQAKPGDYPMLNLDNPAESLFVLKPMSKLPQKIGEQQFASPSSAAPVTHMGGMKMHPNDQSYKAIVAWIEDYARIVHGDYKSVADLPQDQWTGTDLFVQLRFLPEDWPVGQAVQLFVYRWDEEDADWASEPIAFTQGSIAPRKLVVGSLLMIEPTGTVNRSTAPEELPSGRYLVKVYRDQNQKLESSPTLILGEEDFAGQTELKKTRWRAGFKTAVAISAEDLIKD